MSTRDANDREQARLLNDAANIAAAHARAEERLASLSEVRIDSMRALHAAGVAWVQIGKAYGVSPQAAMYATGHAKRSSARKKPAAAKDPEENP